mmetsp:Transcript_2922/g.7616  ORF Transcript_2922/g.7616 Transcript_2922/m.7616 type:complete len:1052 (+) Transcript_2922:263-3418(+)
MGNCIGSARPLDEANVWGEELNPSVKGSRTGLGRTSNAALLHQGSRDGVQLLLRRTSCPSARRSPHPHSLVAEPCTLRPNSSAGAREMLYCQPSASSPSKPFVGTPCEDSQEAPPSPSPRSNQSFRKAAPRPLNLPEANIPETSVSGPFRRSSASTHGSPHQLHAQRHTPSHARRGSMPLPLSPDSILPSPIAPSACSPKDGKSLPLNFTPFPRDSALSVSISSPHTSMPLVDTSLTPSHSLRTHPTAPAFCPPASPRSPALNPTKCSPTKSPKSAVFSRTSHRQPVSKPFTLYSPKSSPLLAYDPTAPKTHQQGVGTHAPGTHAAPHPVLAEAQVRKQPGTPGSGKDVRRGTELSNNHAASAATPRSPCSKMASSAPILPSPFAQQWLAEIEAEGVYGSGNSGGNGIGGPPTEADGDACDDSEQQWIARTHSQGRAAPLFISSTLRHTSAGSYHQGLHSAQHSMHKQASHDAPTPGADDWTSMHMAMAVAAELGEDIPPSSMDMVAVIAAAETHACSSGQPLSCGSIQPGTSPILKRNASTGSSQLASRNASFALQADLSRSTSGAFAQVPSSDLSAHPYAGLRHCSSDRVSPHSSASGRHSRPSHQGSSRLSHAGSARTTPGSRNSNCSSSSARRSPAATLAQLGNLARRPSMAGSTPSVADAMTGLTHALTRRSQHGTGDSTTLSRIGSDMPAASERAFKVMDTTPWTKDPNAATVTRTSSSRGPLPIPIPLPRRPSFPLILPTNKQPSPAADSNSMDASAQKLGRVGGPGPKGGLFRSSRTSCPSGATGAPLLLIPPMHSSTLDVTQQGQQRQPLERYTDPSSGMHTHGTWAEKSLEPSRGMVNSDSLLATGHMQGTPAVAEAESGATGAYSASPTSLLKGLLPPVFRRSELRLSDGMHANPHLPLSPRSRVRTSAPLFSRMSEGGHHHHQQQQRQLHQGELGDARAHVHAPPTHGGGLGGAQEAGSRALTHARSLSQLMVNQQCSGGSVLGSSWPPKSPRDEHEHIALQGFFSPRAAMKNSQSLARVSEALDHSFDSCGSDEVVNL